MLINGLLFSALSFGQTGLDGPVKYEARDSIVANVPSQIVRLYGEAYVNYEGIELKADYIEINLKNNEVLATYSTDSLGLPVGKPLFTSEGEESQCEYVKYNFKTKQGYIKEIRAQQDEGYFHMAESKIHPNEQIHFKNGKFTTCENDTPHYHFKLSKAIIVPDERVVTGPVFMKIGKIPTPLAAPFAFFPNSDSRKHGIILPEFASSSLYGFGLQDFGYYIPLGDYWETQFNGTIYTTGRFAVGNTTNYYRRYKSRGSFGAKFEQFRGQFYDTTLTNKVSVLWQHTQDVKAHPSIKFSASVKFFSDNNGKSSLDTYNPDYFSNQFNSSIKLSKNWKTKKLRGSAALNTSLQQNSVNQSYAINLPDFSFNVSRFDLGVLRKNKIGKKWYEEIKVQYGLRSKNQINAPDSIFNVNDYDQIGEYALNGVEHSVTVNSNLKLFGSRITFTPSAKYREFWNFQYESHEWDTLNQKVDTTDIRGFGAARDVSFSGSMTTGFYGLYKLKGSRKTRFKHVANPTLSFTYKPNISSFEDIQIDVDGNTKEYSPYQNSLYREGSSRETGVLRWNLANTLKMKTKDMKDTINDGDKSFNLIDALSIAGSYDIFADSMAFSDQSISFRTAKLFKVISFQSSATLSPYRFDSLNTMYSDLAIQSNQGFGKITRTTLALSANFTSAQGRKKQKEMADATANNATLTGQVTNPNATSFDIPWQLNVAYNLNHDLVRNKAAVTDSNYSIIQTLVFTGDFSINQKWKFKGGISFNLQQLNPRYHDHINPDYLAPYEDLITTYNFEIWRDLHCWEAMLQFRQYGPVSKDDLGNWGSGQNADWKRTNWTFLFRVNIKASMFQDIKLEYNQPPFF